MRLGSDDDYTEYDNQANVERAIIQNNSTCFHLTEGTPVMQEPLLSDLGYFGDTMVAQQILDGTYECPDGMDDYTREFLQSLQQSRHISPDEQIDTDITKEDFQAYWKKAQERTSSSMSGLHFGHYKAAVKSALLSEMHSVFTHIAVNTGFSPMRWQRGLMVMLEKKEGLIHISKLRATLLMEADFNFSNKLIFGWRMMHFAEDHNDIPFECYGSHQDHKAIDIALNRQLISNIF